MTDPAALMNRQINSLSTEAMRSEKTDRLQAFKNNLSDKDRDEIEHVAREFESVFLSQMIKPMFKELKTDGPFGGGHGEEVFRKLLIEEVGKEFAKSGGLGIADMIERELIEMQSRMMRTDNPQANIGPAPGPAEIEAYGRAESLSGGPENTSIPVR